MHTDGLVQGPYLVCVSYRYRFNDGNEAEFGVDVDLASETVADQVIERRRWAKRDFHGCPHCALPNDEAYCRAALSIIDIVDFFNHNPNYQRAHCTVSMSDRTITAEKSICDAVSSLIGLRLACSGCPVLSRLRPMARFHEPFTTPYQTVYRATTMYLLGQYFCHADGDPADWDLGGLRKLYEAIGKVNMALSERLGAAADTGASPCSMLTLSMFSVSMTILFEEHLEVLKGLFES